MIKNAIVAILFMSSAAIAQAQTTRSNPFTGNTQTETKPAEEVLPIPPKPPVQRQNASPYIANKNPGLQPNCPGDKVVWINLNSQTYHVQDSKYFGNTRNGRFLCEAQAKAGGAKLSHAGQVRH